MQEQAYLNYARYQKEKRELWFFIFMNLIFQVNRYDKGTFAKCGCMPFDSAETSPSFSETFAKKNEWFCIRKPLGKIPQETTELNAWEISARNNKFFFINYDFCNVIIWIFNEDATKTVEISNI